MLTCVVYFNFHCTVHMLYILYVMSSLLNIVLLFCYNIMCTLILDEDGYGGGWRFGVAVTRWSRSTQLLYIEPG